MWSHFDGSNCPGSAVGVKSRLDNGVSGFIHTKNISDKNIKNPEERVKVGTIYYLLYHACVYGIASTNSIFELPLEISKVVL